MLYILMQQEEPVLEMDVNSLSGTVEHINRIYNETRLPIYTNEKNDLTHEMNAWIQGRAIPDSRPNLKALLGKAGVKTPAALSFKNFGLTLSDQYWFKPVDSQLQWSDINLFQNKFSILAFHMAPGKKTEFPASDSSLNGELEKFWMIENNQQFLYKVGTKPYYQQPYNEVFAADLLKKLGLPHVPYFLKKREDVIYSVCPLFTDIDTEYVPAKAILHVREQRNHESNVTHFLHCMNLLHIPVEESQIHTMLAFDYLINNSDRHYGNFGFLKNARKQEFIGMAPLFDHGNSMWYLDSNYDIKLSNQPAKPFKSIQLDQLKLAKKALLPLETVSDEWLTEEIQNIYSQNPRIEEKRLQLFKNRVVALKRMVKC